MRPSSPRNETYCRAATAGLLTILPSSVPAEFKMSWLRTPTRGLAAKVCSAACSRISSSEIPAARMSLAIGASSSTRLADQHAQHLGDQRRLVLAFDLQRALQLEQHASALLRLRRNQARARAHPRPGFDRRDEAHLVQAVIETGRGV